MNAARVSLRVASLATALCLLAAGGAAHAGRDCDAVPATTDAVVRGLALAQRVADRLTAGDVKVAVLARAGRDLSRHGLSWSHLAFALRDADTGAWRVVHKLNHCDAPTAAVFRQGLGEFFLDAPHRYEAAVVVPRADVQQALLAVLRDDTRIAHWHAEPYNLVAYPWSQRYQQSNQWLIETLAGAMSAQADSRARAQAWLQLHDYRPTVLALGPLERLGGRIVAANVAFDDHPTSERFSDRIATVTADSVLQWLVRSRLADDPIVVLERR